MLAISLSSHIGIDELGSKPIDEFFTLQLALKQYGEQNAPK
jgi:hypothetical protein